MIALASLIVLGFSAAAVGGGWYFFRNYQLKRPPIGTFNLWDVAVMLVGIVLIPYLYLALPTWVVGGLLGLGAFGILTFVLEPLLPHRFFPYATALALCVLNVLLTLGGSSFMAAVALNNAIQVLVVIGATNLWAQSGMRARDVTVLGVGLFLYDLVFTSVLPLMTDLFQRLSGLPFAPLIAWGTGNEEQLVIGLGDILLATLFPLVMRKAFGRTSGLVALGVGFGVLTVLLTMPVLGFLRVTFPVMVVLSPLMVLQYAFWRRRCGPERTTQQYLRDEPLLAA